MNRPTDPAERVRALHAQAAAGDAAAGLVLSTMLMRMGPAARHTDIEGAWEAAFAVPWNRPDVMAPAALAYLGSDEVVRRGLSSAASAADIMAAVESLGARAVFRHVMATALVTSAKWLAFLLRWRALAFAEPAVPDAGRSALPWLAVQAHHARYLWPMDADASAMGNLRLRASVESPATTDVLLLACFEHPGVNAQEALDAADPGQRLLLDRLYREPAEERLIAGTLRADAKGVMTGIAQREQYERHPYPSWIREPLIPSAIPPRADALRSRRRWRRERVLLAGCGTGLQCVTARATYAGAAIHAIDFSVASLAYAVRKCREAKLGDIAFEAADLLAFAKRGRCYDLVECNGVLHHLTDMDEGAQALRALVRKGGLLRLAVYSEPARRPIHELRTLIAGLGLDDSMDSLRRIRAELLAGRHGRIPASILESPDFHSAGGLHDLLFNACEHTRGAVAWAGLMARHGFELVCIDPPAAALEAAGPQAQDWGPPEWETFESENPFAFASMYEFWFR